MQTRIWAAAAAALTTAAAAVVGLTVRRGSAPSDPQVPRIHPGVDPQGASLQPFAPAGLPAREWEETWHVARAGWSRHRPTAPDVIDLDVLEFEELEKPLLVAYRGLPGSGKTTQATRQANLLRAAGHRAARLSREDVRRAMGLVGGRTSDEEENEVTEAQEAMLGALAATGVRILLLDDTNLLDDRLEHLGHVAGALGADLRVVDLRDVPVEVCVARDAHRVGRAHVGAGRIRELAVEAGLAR